MLTGFLRCVCSVSLKRTVRALMEVLIPLSQFVNVTYYHHSGFSASIEDILLVFDYWQGENQELPEEKRITPEFLQKFREIYVFISHEHQDHMDPAVFEWRKIVPVTYVVSMDMPVGTRGKRVSPGDVVKLSDRVTVKGFESTDLGVSFLVEACGVKLFHAGDLNFWHWREESTVKEIEEAEEAFRHAVDSITKEEIDLAFFPVDPRQGRLFDAGANYFILSVKPRLMIPMHYWGRAEIAVEFARRSRCRQTEIIAMTCPGEQFRLEMDDQGYMTVHLLSAVEPKPLTRAGSELPIADKRGSVDLDSYDGNDPFSETDLPVRLDD